MMRGIAGFTEKNNAGLAGQNAAAVAWRGAFWLSYAPARIAWKKTEKAFGAGTLTLPVRHPLGGRDAARSTSRKDGATYAEEVEASNPG
jgi:hypothetical protein